MSRQTTIGDLVEVPLVKTVIRLEEGRKASEEIAKSFVFTSQVTAHLDVITEAIAADRGTGYFLQGDFGSGKSHLLAMLYTWLSGSVGAEYLLAAHPGMGEAVGAGRKILPVAVSLIDYRSSTPLEHILLEAAEKALAEEGRVAVLSLRSMLIARVKSMLEQPKTAEAFVALTGAPADPLHEWISENPRQAYSGGLELLHRMGAEAPQTMVEDRKETFERLFSEVEAAGLDGVFLLIDELSEFFRSKPSAPLLNEDARTLQLLGEMTGAHRLWIVAAVQESIEATGDIANSTMRKIKDRFPVRLALSTVHIRSLISERLVRKKPGARKEILRIYENYRNQFPTFSSSFDEFYSVYPVHPATISLLDGLGSLFSRHRGIVDFVFSRIAGDGGRNIASILHRPSHELLGPDSIYDHFSEKLAEFSSYNIYPRHIVPHLDAEIETLLETGEDRYLAKRIVRILVLFRIHPTAKTPTVAGLAELVSCSLDAPEMNALFVSEALLDPIARSSRFLTKKEGDRVESGVYEITTEEDPGKALDARIDRIAGSLEPNDSRLVFEPLSQLPESDSWPGPALNRGSVTREISWRSSLRQVVITYLYPNETIESVRKRVRKSNRGREEWDFLLFIAIGEVEIDIEHSAVWQVPTADSGENLEALAEFLAARLALEELSPSDPSQAPLIPVAEERLNRLKPAALQAALDVVYRGRFTDSRIRPDAAIRQLKRFDRLLETAGTVILEDRYPRFAEVAPRGFSPSPRFYQYLLESLIVPGSLSLSEARRRSLNRPIEGLAIPLGLVELKRQMYLYSPDVSGHPLLSHLFDRISPSGYVPVPELLETLMTGVFGLPRDTALFLLASLAAGGLITIRKGGRALALDFLNLQNLERADEVTLGELVGEHDRRTLMNECRFLRTSGDWESFGLRQQREAWQEVIRFRNVAEKLAGETLGNLRRRREYSSFKTFGFVALEEKLAAVGRIGGEIRISYTAKEGLEKFLSAFRAEGLSGDDVSFLIRLDRFLKRGAEKFVFINHYIRHDAFKETIGFDEEVASRRRSITELLERPEESVVPDEGVELDRRFEALRELYVPLYARLHDEYYDALRLPELPKNTARALQTIERLARIEALDRPPGLDRFLSDLAARHTTQCRRQIREELMRAPLCGCGFHPKRVQEEPAFADPGMKIDRYLEEYLAILNTPGVLEPLTAHAYAIEDVRPEVSRHLKRIVSNLEAGSMRPSALVGSIDDSTALEVSRALSGAVTLRKIDLDELVTHLTGRRLPPARILSLVSEWMGACEEDTLVAVVGRGASAQPEKREATSWWLLGNSRFFSPDAGTDEIEKVESLLAESYPSSQLLGPLKALSQKDLLAFIRRERFHTACIRDAWAILAERVLNGSGFPETREVECAHADVKRAKEIEDRLLLLQRTSERLGALYPDRLRVRLNLESLVSDPWCDDSLRTAAESTLEKVETLGQTWLNELPAVDPIRLENNPLVLLIDGVSPDIWLSVLDGITTRGERPAIGWSRLTSRPETVAATAELLGLSGDPSEKLAEIGVPYVTMSGREGFPLSSRLEGFSSRGPLIVRLNTLDRNAHKGTFKLSEMVGVLDDMMEKNLPELLRFCAGQQRDLIVTTDHGISLAPGGMSHGEGGAYERAIFRAVWKC